MQSEHFIRELHSRQLQITNLPCLIPEQADDPAIPYGLIWSCPALKVIQISHHDPLDFAPLDEEESELEEVMAALFCGDQSLLSQPQDSPNWWWHQQIPQILAGEHPDWRLYAAAMDISGISFYIAHRQPLPDGSTYTREFMLDAPSDALLSLQIQDGCIYNYIQLERPAHWRYPTQGMIASHPDGATECITFHPSATHQYSTELCITRYRQ